MLSANSSRTVRMMFGILAMVAVPAMAGGSGVVKFSEAGYFLAEGNVVQVLVERSQGEDGAASVRVISNGGSATVGSDYNAVDMTLQWFSGDGTDRFVSVPLTDDAIAEGSETIQLMLVDATGASIDATRSTSILTILDNDGGSGGSGGSGGMFEFDERTYYANENAGVAVITVERSEGEQGEVTVSYIADPGTANAGSDFDEVSGTLRWGNGDDSLRYFEVPLIADNQVEASESVSLMLFSPTGGGVLNATRSSATLTILDGNSSPSGLPGTLRFDERTFEVMEGQVNALVRVERSGGRSGGVTVRVSTSDGSATSGADYLASSATLGWASGDSATKTLRVPIFDDSIEDGNESINLALSNPSGGATIDPLGDTALVNILDDDAASSICEPGDDSGCLQNNRFAFEVTYRTSVGLSGLGHVVPLTSDSAVVWFFRPDNLEILIKVLDACDFDGAPAFWVFFASTTNVDFTVTVTDTHTGVSRDYRNLLGQPAQTVLDTSTFKFCGQ